LDILVLRNNCREYLPLKREAYHVCEVRGKRVPVVHGRFGSRNAKLFFENYNQVTKDH